MDGATNAESAAERKSPFDNLDRDELIKKCKGLLSIAQKAKKAKDEFATELTSLREQVSANETQRCADDEKLETMQLIVQSTTDQKLELTIRIEHLERQLTDTTNRLSDANKRLNDAHSKLVAFEAMEIELEGQRKQIKRLTEENEEQETDLRELDAKFSRVSELSQRQTHELLQLEQSVENWKRIEADYERLTNINRTLQATIEANAAQESNRTQQRELELKPMYEKMKCDFEANVSELNELRSSLDAKHNECTAEWENLTAENKRVKDQVNEQQQKLGKYQSKVIEFAGKLKLLKKCKQTLLETVSEYSVSVTQWQRDISAASNVLVQQMNKLHAEKETLAHQLRAGETTIGELQAERDALSSELQDLLAKCMESDQLEEMRANLMAENVALKSEMERQAMSDESQIQSARIKQMETELKETEEKRALNDQQNEDLLAEMRELNDALKNRGNVISKQTNELETLRAKQQEQSVRIAQLEDALREKAKSLEQLKTQYESQSDIMSTSTISRAEDVARMHDIEDSFEEKYNKLRGLAIKQKRKIAEQQAIIGKLETSAVAEAPATEATNIKIQNLKSMQAENDRLLDEIDAMKANRKEMSAASKKLTDNLAEKENELKSLRLTNEDAQAMADTNYRTKCALDETIRNGEIEKDQLRTEIKRLKEVQVNLEAEIGRGKDLLQAKEAELTSRNEQVSKLKADLVKLRASMKKSNVLNLEMEAYEKSSKEMTQKLEAKVVQLAEMEAANMSQEATIKSLRAEIKQLNESLETEKQLASESQQDCDLLRIKLRDSITDLAEAKQTIDANAREIALNKVELTNLLSEQSQFEVEKQKLITQWKNESENNVSQLCTLEEQVRGLSAKYNACEQELAQVQTEYTNYKVRAQSVLRQNQSHDSSAEKELREEIDLLTRTKEEFAAKLATLAEQNRQSNIVADDLKLEKQNLQDRCRKLMDLLDVTRQQMDVVQSEMRKQMQEHQEALKTHRLQIDTLNGCFKRQIDEMKSTYDEQLSEWKAKVAAMIRGDHLNGNAVALESNKARGHSAAEHATYESPLSEEQQRIEMILTERQAGEGSESTGSLRKISNARNRRDLIPLDELLFEDQDDVDDHLEQPMTTLDVEAAKEKLAMQQSRVTHLAALLSEAECDVARLTQLNDVLKEEVRRQERSTEREMHMHNLEYMKNVIFKFLTINNGDERAHLVPVLNTILKLSADECKQLQSVAKGGDAAQSSWSNILPNMW